MVDAAPLASSALKPHGEFSIDQDHCVQQVRQMLLRPTCVGSRFSAAGERLAADLYRRGVELVHIQSDHLARRPKAYFVY